MELIGPYVVACTLLVVAGAMKAIRPEDTARAVTQMVPLPIARLQPVIRLGAMVEASLGLVALALPRTVTAALVAASYLLFAGVVAYARAKGGAVASCGCFGTPDTPATLLHVIVNLGLAGAAIGVAVAAPAGSIVSVLATQPWAGVPLVAASALCTWLTYLALSVLAALHAARRLAGATSGRWR